MKAWYIAPLAVVGVGLSPPAAPAFHPAHPLFPHLHHHKPQPNVIVVPGVATAPQVVTQSYSVQSVTQSYSLPAVTYSVPSVQMYAVGAGGPGIGAHAVQSYSLAPAASFSAESQSLNPVQIRNILRTVGVIGGLFDEAGSRPSGDLSDRVRDLERRVDALERDRPKADTKPDNSKPGQPGKPGLKKGSPSSVEQQSVDAQSAGGLKQQPASEVQKLAQSLAELEQLRDKTTLEAQRTLRSLEYQHARTAEDIRMLREFLTPGGPAPAPLPKGKP